MFWIREKKRYDDMSQIRSALAQSINESSFHVSTGSGHSITLSGGTEDQGASPMEALLVALAGCTGVGIRSILRKMHQEVTDYQIHVHGELSEDTPRVFTSIVVEHIFTGSKLQSASIQRAIDLDTQQYCGVHAMLSQSADIKHIFQLREVSE
jgi:putative redox protein